MTNIDLYFGCRDPTNINHSYIIYHNQVDDIYNCMIYRDRLYRSFTTSYLSEAMFFYNNFIDIGWIPIIFEEINNIIYG
jgi:hypothetical protein